MFVCICNQVTDKQIRQAAEGNVPVLNRLAETLERLTRLAKTEDQKKIIQRHFEMLVRSCRRSVPEPLDREHIQQCLNRIEETISWPVNTA